MTQQQDKTYLAFDFGLKHIGVAVGQSITQTASPLTTLSAKDGIPDWEVIKTLIENWKPSDIIVGIPLNMDGTEQPMTFKARKFANRLKTRFQLPVHDVDERLSSYEAKHRLLANAKRFDPRKLKQTIDAVAASILLEQWMGG